MPWRFQQVRHRRRERGNGPDANALAFPLGGIGTGTISLGARGNLRDFEIWNEPRKGWILPYTHFALWCRAGDGPASPEPSKGRIQPHMPPRTASTRTTSAACLAVAESRFRGRYPMPSWS